MKPLLYIPAGAIGDTSPFSITRKPVNITTKSCFVFFEDENFHYAVEYEKPEPGKGGLENLARISPWGPSQISGAKRIGSERGLRKVQMQAR